MAQVTVFGNEEYGRRVDLVYDSLSPDEAKKFIDAFSIDKELCNELNFCEDVRMTFDSIDHGDGTIGRTICIFIDGLSVYGTDDFSEHLLETSKHDLEYIRLRIKTLTGIE